MNSHETRIVAEYLTANFEGEMQATLRVLSALPAGKLEYRPDAMAKNALGLMRHIVLEDEWLLNSIADGKFEPPPDDSDACGIMTSEDAVARYQAKLPAAVARVRAMSGDDLNKTIDLFGMIQGPGIDFLAMAVKHSVHHRGQLSTYIRPMGGRVPGIYGPSADTQAASA